MKKISLIILLVIGFYGRLAFAAPNLEIAATVGDDAISSLDLKERMEFTIRSSGLKDSPETREKLKDQVIKMLIDEKIYEQEAKKNNISVDDFEMQGAVATLEEKNGIKAGTFDSFLKSKNISPEIARKQLKAQLLWGKIITKKVRPDIVVTERELEEKMENLSNSSDGAEINIAEIVLNFNDTADEKKVKTLADNLVKQIRDGAKFEAVAKEFSNSTTAESGGDMGWSGVDDLPKEIVARIRNLSAGDVSDPFVLGGAYHIVTVKERKAMMKTKADDDKVSIKQAFVTGNAEEAVAKIKAASASVKSCNGFDSFARAVNSSLSTQVINTGLKDMNPEIAAVVNEAEVGSFTRTVKNNDGVFVFMVCGRTDPKKSVIQRNRVYEVLMRNKIDLQAQKYLQNLKKKTYIEIRG